MRQVHPPTAGGPGDGLAFAFLFGLHDESTGGIDVENLETELAGIQDDIAALQQHGFRVIVDTEAVFETLTGLVYATDPDLAGCRAAGLLWSSHGEEEGGVQTCRGDWFNWTALDPTRVVPDLRTVIFSACHVGRWEPYWKRALPPARVYGWGKPVAFDRAREFYDPTSESAVRLDVILERDLRLRKGSIAAMHRAMQEDVPEDGDGDELPPGGLGDLLRQTMPYLRVPTASGPRFDPAAERPFVDLLLDGGRHQRVILYEVNPSEALMPLLGEGPMICVESSAGPFPPDGRDDVTGVEVDPDLLRAMSRELEFARVQIDGDPVEVLRVQCCIDQSVLHPSLVALVIHEVGQAADRIEESVYGVDRR